MSDLSSRTAEHTRGLKPYHLTVDFGGTNIRISHVGDELAPPRVVPTHAEYDAEGLRAYFLAALDAYVQDTGIAGLIEDVNVAIAGQIERESGVLLASPNLPSWHLVPLKRWLEEHFGVPAHIDNDVRSAALGERKCLGLEHVADIVCLYWGTGIGGGIIVNGSLVRGVNNAAGEVGHMVYQAGGRLCNCRKQGCYEAYAGGWAISEIAREAVAARPDKELGPMPTTADVFQLADAGHPVAERIRSEAALAFSILAANLVVAFNPAVLVLGGGLTKHYAPIEDVVRQTVAENALEADRTRLEIVRSVAGDAAALWGAAYLSSSY